MNEIKITGVDTNLISDGYHTFGELYEHRIELWIALCRMMQTLGEKMAWRSWKHSDGTSLEGWFVLGIGWKPGQQITYHLPEKYWDRCEFAVTGHWNDLAPEFDGHTSADVLERLKTL